MANMKCPTCDTYVMGEREHATWCRDMRDWEKDRLGPERRIVAAMEHAIDVQKQANEAKANLIAIMEEVNPDLLRTIPA